MKNFISLVSASLLCAAITACGGGGSSAATTSGTAPVAGAPVNAPVIAPVVPTAVETALNLDLTALANYASPVLPAHYDAAVRALDNTPGTDPVTDRVATLGRVLFYDKHLSFNDTVACASCHQQAQGFSDPARFSTGFSGSSFTTAHAMRLGNVRYYRPGSAFWDRRAASIEDQATQPIQHPVEMGFDASHGGLDALFLKMQGLAYYPELFQFAFGDTTITESRIQRALAQFQRSMVSSSSRWDTAYASAYDPALPDKGLATPVPGFTAEEERGRSLFVTPPPQGGLGCAGCHVSPTFAQAANSHSNGLDAGETVLFKSPSLKSVAVNSAFMHDGRFSSLEQVVEHYNSGVQAGPALDNRLIGGNGAPRRLNLSTADKAAVVAFLKTLTDPTLAADTRFANPFKP